MSDVTDKEMAGVKRDSDGKEKEQEVGGEAESEEEVELVVESFVPMFESFRDSLDEHHDRREKIIKASRDVTAASKKIIFALQRVKELKQPLPPGIAKEVAGKKAVIQKALESISSDLQGINAWRYQRQVSGGIQEFMEAISFEHYLKTQTLITPEEAAAALPRSMSLTSDDYILGIFDLVGEIMRFAITNMATTGRLPGSTDLETGEETTILTDLRRLRAGFEGLDTTMCKGGGLAKDIGKKMGVMRECVQKVETAVYRMVIEGRVRPAGWSEDGDGERGMVEGY